MSCHPIDQVSEKYSEPSKKEIFFEEDEYRKINNISYKNELHVDPLNPCQRNLFIGTFLDGTCNNYLQSYNAKDGTETNVVHLYNAYPGTQMLDALRGLPGDWREKTAQYDNYYKIYASGVGSPFLPVYDDGNSLFGSGAGKYGEARILWALMQVMNAVFRFANGVDTPLFSYDSTQFKGIDTQGVLNRDTALCDPSDGELQQAAMSSLLLSRDRMGTGNARRANDTKAARLFMAWLHDLNRCLRPGLHGVDKIKTIHLSCFGFSRGAVEARCFAHYLVYLCKLDARLNNRSGLTLGGKPVAFDFMGLFDSVASVGMSDTYSALSFSRGHSAWGNNACIRIPREVGQCVHMVAAHEQRTDFPLDSIFAGGQSPDNAEEIVFPGVHSDLGGGYALGLQGKSPRMGGVDLLSKIPLAVMYKKARLAGVPLKVEEAPAEAVINFKISPALIADFNAYTAYINQRMGTDWHHTGDIIAHHYHAMLEWRFYLLTRGNHRAFMAQAQALTSRFPKPKPSGDAFEDMKANMEEAWSTRVRLGGYAEQIKAQLSCYQQAGRSAIELSRGVERFLNEMERFILPRVGGYIPVTLEDGRNSDVTNRYFESDATPDKTVFNMLDRYVHDSYGGYDDTPTWLGKNLGRGYYIYLRPRYIFAGDDDSRLEVVMRQHLGERERRVARRYLQAAANVS